MNKSVQLPFCRPVFCSTQGQAAVGLAANTNPTAYNQILNQAISNACSRKFLKGYTSPEVTMQSFTIYDYSFIQKYDVNMRFAYKHVHDIVKYMLESGFFVFYRSVDDFYIPGKSWYGIRHMYHDGVICGYDDETKTYSIAAYDMNWLYNLIQVPQELFEKALVCSIDSGEYGVFSAFKAKEGIIKLEEGIILRKLKDYLISTVDKHSLEETGYLAGIAVHDFLAMYIGKLKDGSIPYEKMDWRALRPIWEHKKCMLDRICAIEKKHNWEDELSREYQAIVEIANKDRMMYALYHKKRRDSILPKIESDLIEIREKESEILKRLVSKMEENTK